MLDAAPISYRIVAGTAAEVPFIAATWKRSQRWLGGNAKLSFAAFWEHWNAHAVRVFEQGAKCMVAIDDAAQVEGKPFIFGYLVCEDGRCVHHLYVRQGFRRFGIAGHLLGNYRGPRVYACDVDKRTRKLAAIRGWKKGS